MASQTGTESEWVWPASPVPSPSTEGGGVHHGCGVGEAGQLWSVQLDPCWAEFVDRPGSSRPRAFVEPLPLTLWLGAPTQGGSSRVPLLLYVPAPLRLQLGRRECAFLLRLARSAAIVQEQTAVDRQVRRTPTQLEVPKDEIQSNLATTKYTGRAKSFVEAEIR